MPIVELNVGNIVHVYGIERYSGSDVLGELVAPVVNLWPKKRMLGQYRTPIATAEHGEEGQIIDMCKDRDGVQWYRLDIAGVKGWVKFIFIEEAVMKGESYGAKDIGWA